jgi:hypothetical protein
MTKQENDAEGEQVVVIAIPVTTECECLEQWLANEWSSPLVVGHGQEKEMPLRLRTSQFARNQKVTIVLFKWQSQSCDGWSTAVL